jgi:hypothetical protein
LRTRDLTTLAQIGALDSQLDSLGDGIHRRAALSQVEYAGGVPIFVSPAQELPRQSARDRGGVSRKNADLPQSA